MAVAREPRDAAIKNTMDSFRDQFLTPHNVSYYLFRTLFPPSRRWVYKPCAKSGTSSVLKFLFEVEFQTRLTVKTTPEDDINPSHEFHLLANARVFGRALEYGYSLPNLLNQSDFGERIAVCRNPYDRALSAYRYICLSHSQKSRWFELERVRMVAAHGFDWDVHTNSSHGFDLFLQYIEHEIETVGVNNLDEHWRPQFDVMKPAAFQPTIIGRLEDTDTFLNAIAERIGPGLSADLSRENVTSGGLSSRDISQYQKEQIERIYKNDFEYFSY